MKLRKKQSGDIENNEEEGDDKNRQMIARGEKEKEALIYRETRSTRTRTDRRSVDTKNNKSNNSNKRRRRRRRILTRSGHERDG